MWHEYLQSSYAAPGDASDTVGPVPMTHHCAFLRVGGMASVTALHNRGSVLAWICDPSPMTRVRVTVAGATCWQLTSGVASPGANSGVPSRNRGIPACTQVPVQISFDFNRSRCPVLAVDQENARRPKTPVFWILRMDVPPRDMRTGLQSGRGYCAERRNPG